MMLSGDSSTALSVLLLSLSGDAVLVLSILHNVMVFASSTLYRVKRPLVQWTLRLQVSRLNVASWRATFYILESFRRYISGEWSLFLQLLGNGKTVFSIAATVIQGGRRAWSLAVAVDDS